ncbi:Magnesium and cobalt efflux protein CorC [bacterium HR37]|nr:Magnesium and cobalt efflux protein CorC [bacterium HR37]
MLFVFTVSILTAISVSFICSLTEAVLLSLNPLRLETLKQEGKTYASVLLEMKENIDRPIAAILILNTIAHTGGAIIAGGAFNELYGDNWLWLFSIVFTLVILFGTEIIPKVLGVRYNESLAPWLVSPLRVSISVLKPVIFLTEALSRIFWNKKREQGLSIADIKTLARIAKVKEIIEPEQENIIINATKLRETKVSSVMIPREWIIYLKSNLSLEENFEIAKNNFHTRYPVSKSDSVDDIIGYVNYKEIAALASHLGRFTIDQFIRPVLFVTPDINLNTMLKLFIAKRHHLAIVKDSGGKVVGMVTLEDVLEEIVGDIEDEFDYTSQDIVQISPNIWRVGGDVQLQTLSRIVGIELDDATHMQTVARWLQSKIKGTIYPGVSFTHKNIKFIVQQIRRGKIHRVTLEILDKNAQYNPE